LGCREGSFFGWHYQTFSFCILTATGSCITKIVSVWLPPTNHKGVLKGLSRMRGNSHVRFLGEGVSVMGPPYPTWGNIDFERHIRWETVRSQVAKAGGAKRRLSKESWRYWLLSGCMVVKDANSAGNSSLARAQTIS
jgi:hypothetical protein